MDIKPIEIFCGTGGVGKTTLATSRAINLASKGYKVLLVTIDPAKRLKQILNLEEQSAGKVCEVPLSLFPDYIHSSHSMDALLMNPSTTLERMAKENDSFKDFDNHIVKILTKPHGGMNEIMAIIEVQYHINSKRYDTIVLDTPPGKHFIDFLDSTKKIQQFFDKTFVEIFKYLGKNFTSNKKEKSGFVGMLVKTGIKKLLSYLEKVTGATFVDDFIEAIVGLYKNKDSFLKALEFQEDLKRRDFSNWFLVTSVEQHKVSEAEEIQDQASQFMHHDSFLAVNKCLAGLLENWQKNDKDSPLSKLRQTMLEKENKLKEVAGKSFQKTIEFPEVLSPTPVEHVQFLAKVWDN